MATFSALKSSNEIQLDHVGRSGNLATQSGFPAMNCSTDVPTVKVATKSGSNVVSVVSWGGNAQKDEMFCGRLFERVIVVPRTRALGFVLSDAIFSVEVWNAYQNSAKTLNSISISGGSGVSISGAFSIPGEFGPSRSFIFTATVSQDGPASIASVVTFNFSGGVTGADLTITGSRLTVFSVEIDWSEGFEETIEYKTAIVKSFSSSEQRIQLRTKPRYGAKFSGVTLNAKDTASLDAVVASWQARVFGVPWWMDASPLTAIANVGAMSLSVDTTNRPSFDVGGLVMIWKDQFTWEALIVVSVASGSIGLSTAIAKTWPAGSLVVPLKRGRMAENFGIKRETMGIASFSASFACEVV